MTALALCALLAAGMALQGCSPEAAVVGRVGDANITVKDVYDYGNYFMMQLSMSYGVAMTSADLSADEKEQLYDQALSDLVDNAVVMRQAEAEGLYPLSAANQSKVDNAISQLADTGAQFGLDKNALKKLLTAEEAYVLVRADAVKSAAVSDGEIKAEYDKEVADQKASFDKDASAYESAKADGSTTIVYRPAGYRYVKDILIAMPSDIQTQIETAQSGGDPASVQKLREQGLPQIQGKADEALAKLQSGGDFDALMAQYGEDPDMQQDPGKTSGREVGSAADFPQECKDAALALKNVGNVTGLIAADDGYHILKYVGDVPAGPVALDSVKDALKSALLADKQSQMWDAALAGWKAGLKIEQHPEKIPIPVSTATPAD